MAMHFHLPVTASQRTNIPENVVATSVSYSSFFSLHCQVRSKTWPNYCSDNLLKVSSITRTSKITLISSSCDQVTSVSNKWRVFPRLMAAVAQEDAAAVEEEEKEEALTVQEEEVVEEKGGEGSDESRVGEGVNTKLYFGNLPFFLDSAQLAGVVEEYATPEMVQVIYDKETGRSRGFAFVTMASLEECDTVIENLDGTAFGGRALKVNYSDKPKPRGALYPDTEHKLFIGNLSWTVTSESLAEAFRGHGTVVGARVIYDKEKGRSSGYGFVSYETREQMENALQNLDGLELEGRPIRVYIAEKKK